MDLLKVDVSYFGRTKLLVGSDRGACACQGLGVPQPLVDEVWGVYCGLVGSGDREAGGSG